MYHGISYLLKDIYSNWGLEYTFVDMSDPDRVDSAIKPSTKLIWIETPSNPLLKLYDIAAISDLAHRRNIKIACDNTFATPVLQSPFELGADLVMHSTTKYLSGHSDVLGGALVSRENDEFFGKIQNVQKLSGAVPSPFDCYLTMRGIKTLPYRMRGHCENALKIAAWLESHSRVESVFYPGLPGSPYYELARRQMKGFGGMLSFLVRGGADMARKVAGTTSLFVQATSLGGVESLIEHRASVEGPETKTPQNLLRVSAGLEHPDDLIADLDRALSA
jgi:cystathionine gamma-synthase